MAESAPAFLLLQGRVGNYSPEQYFSQYYPRENPRTYAGRAMYLCVYGDSLYALDLLREDPATGQLDWVRTDAKFQVAWQNRSRTGYALGHLGYYLFAVPLDIITFPYQLFVVLTLAH
jgi:hypothetical protein